MKIFPLRLSDDLHSDIKKKAWAQDKSIHQYILDKLSEKGFVHPTHASLQPPQEMGEITTTDLELQPNGTVTTGEPEILGVWNGEKNKPEPSPEFIAEMEKEKKTKKRIPLKKVLKEYGVSEGEPEIKICLNAKGEEIEVHPVGCPCDGCEPEIKKCTVCGDMAFLASGLCPKHDAEFKKCSTCGSTKHYHCNSRKKDNNFRPQTKEMQLKKKK